MAKNNTTKKITTRKSGKSGLPPGIPMLVGERKSEHLSITVIDYDTNRLDISYPEHIEDCFSHKALNAHDDKTGVTWIAIAGLHEVDAIAQLGKHFNLHPLTIEDALNTDQHPKIDFYDNYVYIDFSLLRLTDDNSSFHKDQISIAFGRNFIISLLEKESPLFDPLIERLKQEASLLRKYGPDFLAYSIIDMVIDNYFAVLEALGDDMDEIEGNLLRQTKQNMLVRIHRLRRDFIRFRKATWPLREIVNAMLRQDTLLIDNANDLFLKDIDDHIVQVNYTLESYRDIIFGLHDIHLANVNIHMNEIMKMLTIIGTIFMPLSFIASLYGMNFKYMPELEWHWGYYTVLGCMAMVVLTFVIYFKRSKWL